MYIVVTVPETFYFSITVRSTFTLFTISHSMLTNPTRSQSDHCLLSLSSLSAHCAFSFHSSFISVSSMLFGTRSIFIMMTKWKGNVWEFMDMTCCSLFPQRKNKSKLLSLSIYSNLIIKSKLLSLSIYSDYIFFYHDGNIHQDSWFESNLKFKILISVKWE